MLRGYAALSPYDSVKERRFFPRPRHDSKHRNRGGGNTEKTKLSILFTTASKPKEGGTEGWPFPFCSQHHARGWMGVAPNSPARHYGNAPQETRETRRPLPSRSKLTADRLTWVT